MMLPMALGLIHLLWTPMMRKATLTYRRRRTTKREFYHIRPIFWTHQQWSAPTTEGDVCYGCRQNAKYLKA
jgi:hypothetical protein